MSLIYSKVDVPENIRILEASLGTSLLATIDPNTISESPLSNNYKLTKWCVPSKYEQFEDRIRNFKIRHDDIWMLGYFKSGTTWVHNIILQLKNSLDFSAPTVDYIYNVLERPTYHTAKYNEQFDYYDQMPSPRIFKSHLPAYLLPKELWTVRPKIIYTARNPKDIAVSLYHFVNALYELNLPKELFFEACLNESSTMSPIHAHVLTFWEMRNLDHVHFSKYEDFLADQRNGVKQISEFLECSLTDQEITDLTDHVSFKNMKQSISMTTLNGRKMKDSGYRFCRKGKAGTYRDEMSQEYINRFDEWTADRLKNSDFTYPNV